MKEKKEDLKCKVCGKDSEYWDNGYYCKKCFLKRNDHLMKHNNRIHERSQHEGGKLRRQNETGKRN